MRFFSGHSIIILKQKEWSNPARTIIVAVTAVTPQRRGLMIKLKGTLKNQAGSSLTIIFVFLGFWVLDFVALKKVK